VSDITSGYTWTDGEKGVTATKMNTQLSGAVINPEFYSTKSSSATLDPTDTLLELKNTNAYAKITGSQLISSVSSQVDATPQIWSTRLRSFNAVGNPTFAIDQKNVGATVAVPNPGNFYIDRWAMLSSGSTMRISAGQQAGNINVPGTNFAITGTFLRTTLTAGQASLAAGDLMQLVQNLEGIRLRELINDVHSCQILARCSSPLKFGVSFRDGGNTRSLTKLCTISTANAWTLIPLPNLPLWSSGATWPVTPGALGYSLTIALASGSSNTSPANDTFQNGSFAGAAGQDSFAALAVNSTFDLAFIQHEPGAVCTTPMDCPFTQNYDDCLRYYTKSYGYATLPGANTSAGQVACIIPGNANLFTYMPFKKTMAKTPTVMAYSTDGTVNAVRDATASVNRSVNAVVAPADSGFSGFNMTTVNAAQAIYALHYTADTGW
jgi:hypothetical protein